MRNLIVFLVLCLLVLVAITEAKKGKGKKEWRQYKKQMMKKNRGDDHVNGMDKKYKHAHHGKGKGEGNHKWNRKDKHHKKYGKFSPRQNLEWLKAKDGACEPACTEGDVCITGPVDSKPICVRYKDLKKSMKLFHKYQKKEMKAWRKFKKGKYHHHDDLDKQYPRKMVEKQYSTEVKEAFMDKNGFDKHGKHHNHGMHEKHDKHGKHEKYENHLAMKKQQHLKASGYDVDLVSKISPEKKPEEKGCSESDLSQMRSRLSGWFHVLHGVEHLAGKHPDVSIKHFHKHNSVKKEMRQHRGDSCGCFKSAMWYFTVLDKDGSDALSVGEAAAMEPHSGEPCVDPYLRGCDSDADGKLSSDEWCCCFAHVAPPCFKHLKEIKKSKDSHSYIPRCDKEGYYMREQCSTDKEEGFKCWCSDANGTPLKGTEVEGGRAHCTVAAKMDIKAKYNKGA